MNIKHFPITATSEIEKIYSEKDGVKIKYVCTTELVQSNHPVDVFYRETPHPIHENKYFWIGHIDGSMIIGNADSIENLTFGLVENDDGQLEYSSYRHDFKSFNNGNMIDGGRDYIRSSGSFQIFSIREGQFVSLALTSESCK